MTVKEEHLQKMRETSTQYGQIEELANTSESMQDNNKIERPNCNIRQKYQIASINGNVRNQRASNKLQNIYMKEHGMT